MKKLFSFLLLLFLPFSIMAAEKSLDDVVAFVNDDVIMESDLQKEIQAYEESIGQKVKVTPALRQEVLTGLVNKKIERQYADRLGITVSDREIDEAIKAIVKRNNSTVEDLKEMLSERAIPFSQYRDSIKDQMILARFQQMVAGADAQFDQTEFDKYVAGLKSKIKPEDNLYDVWHIVFSIPDQATKVMIKSIERKANVVYQQLKAGKISFKEAAQKYSPKEDLSLGERHLSDFPSIFIPTLKTMSEGDVSKPILAPNGFHILKIVSVKNALSSLSETDLKNQFMQNKFAAAINKWLQQERPNNYIKYAD